MCDNILTALKGTGKISIVWRNQQLLVCKETTCQLIRKILLFVFTCRKLRIRHDFSKVMRDQITGQAVKFNHGCFESCSTVTTIISCWCCLFHREQTTCKKTLGHTGCVNTSHSWHSRRFHAWWARHSLSSQEAQQIRSWYQHEITITDSMISHYNYWLQDMTLPWHTHSNSLHDAPCPFHMPHSQNSAETPSNFRFWNKRFTCHIRTWWLPQFI